MSVRNIFRRLRGAFGNALVWGIGWVAAGLALMVPLRVFGILSFPWADIFVFAARMGIVGAATGGAFSVVIPFFYHGRRLSEINWIRFGIGGGVVTGLFVPLFLQTMNLLSGDGLVPWELVLDDGLWTAVFGGTAAGGSLKIAQRSHTELPEGTQGQADLLEGVDQT